MEKVSSKGDNLLQQLHDNSPERSVITNKVTQVGQNLEDLQDKLRRHETTLEEKIKKTSDFNKNIEILETWIEGARELLATLGPVSTDPLVVEKQLHDVQVFH